MLESLAKQVGMDVSAANLDACARYLDLVGQWNKKTSLTSNMSKEERAEVLFVDAWALFSSGLVEPSTLVDVGAGVGAPGIPLGLAMPELKVTLVEPRRRRVAFLRTAIGMLGLQSRIDVLEKRGEQVGGQLEGSWDQAMSRATFEPQEWLARGPRFAPAVLVLSSSSVEAPDSLRFVRSAHYEIPSTNQPRWAGRFESPA